MRILLVEDDDRVAAALRTALARQQIEVTRLASGRDVVAHLPGTDVVLLDLGLPDVDGIDVCRRIREAGDTPVIVVSARGEVEDRILGLHSGADDYLVKPYDAGELLARIHTVLRRRRPGPADDVVDLGAGLVVDLARREVRDGADTVALSRKEFAVLAQVARADGAVCTRERIVAEVWGRTWPGANRTLDVHVATLRTKLGRPDVVATVRGVGYRLTRR